MIALLVHACTRLDRDENHVKQQNLFFSNKIQLILFIYFNSLNMYLYLNVFYAPASHVLAYPNANATLIPIRYRNLKIKILLINEILI